MRDPGNEVGWAELSRAPQGQGGGKIRDPDSEVDLVNKHPFVCGHVFWPCQVFSVFSGWLVSGPGSLGSKFRT